MTEKQRSLRNRTLRSSKGDAEKFGARLVNLSSLIAGEHLVDCTIHGDLFQALPKLRESCVDLMIMDPPYNLDKNFHGLSFKKLSIADYCDYIETWLLKLLPLLKPNASIYICGDWRTSTSIHLVCQRHLHVINRITWERDKGRGAKRNWKNCTEDIWFCTNGVDYPFYVESVKMKRKVMAPYKVQGKPKDWEASTQGAFRITHPSNIWTDITIPYWSMPENTEHPTQKPEKLIAKLILASTKPGDLVFDPFLGAGTTSVVAKKLGRRYLGVEINRDYCILAEKRLEMAESDAKIQGYTDGVFWERNTSAMQSMGKAKSTHRAGMDQSEL